jgi:hypothetical protein
MATSTLIENTKQEQATKRPQLNMIYQIIDHIPTSQGIMSMRRLMILMVTFRLVPRRAVEMERTASARTIAARARIMVG